MKINVMRKNIFTLGTEDGQRNENKHLTSTICEKIIQNPYTDVSTMGICTDVKLSVLQKQEAQHCPEGSETEQFLSVLGTVTHFVYGGHYQFKGTRQAEPYLKGKIKEAAANRDAVVYCGLTREEKVYLCNQHNEVADVHVSMTNFDKIVIVRKCFIHALFASL
jgi:hypothetical protein